jgi:hypothetical protein
MTGWSDASTIDPLSVQVAREIGKLTAGASTQLAQSA